MKKKNIVDLMWISIMFFPHVLEFLLMSLKYNKIKKKNKFKFCIEKCIWDLLLNTMRKILYS